MKSKLRNQINKNFKNGGEVKVLQVNPTQKLLTALLSRFKSNQCILF